MLSYLQVTVLENGDVVALGQILGKYDKMSDFIFTADCIANMLNSD